MQRHTSDAEAWKKMVLRSMPAPGWLTGDAPESDVVISSRVRYARNLAGFTFPHAASPEELRLTQRLIYEAEQSTGLNLEAFKRLTEAEREYMVGCRLISPEFKGREPGRMLLLDSSRTISLMVNEEDHLRLQALLGGWALRAAAKLADHVLANLSQNLRWAESETWGFLTSSPYNCGIALRHSALFHLIGLAHSKRLPSVLKALTESGYITRGLFGESSRAVGAYVQVSTTSGNVREFVGACEYIAQEERQSRREIPRNQLDRLSKQASEFAVSSSELSWEDALRVLAWVRLAAVVGLLEPKFSYRTIDAWISELELRGTTDATAVRRQRADYIRERLGR